MEDECDNVGIAMVKEKCYYAEEKRKGEVWWRWWFTMGKNDIFVIFRL